MEKDTPCKWKSKESWSRILISDKLDFKIKTVTRDKEGHYIMIKGSIQEDMTMINIYTCNIGAPQYIRKMPTSISGEIASNTIIVGSLIPHLHQWTDHSDRKSIKKQKLGFPGGAVVESLPANAGDTGSSPGLGGSHMPRSGWAREPQLLSLCVWSLFSATRGRDGEGPVHHDEEWPPLAATRESPRTKTKTQHSQN